MSDSDLYSRLLFPKMQGYPLFHPQPFDDLPEPARRTGTEIGDVGLVTQEGSFDPIFNILRAKDDPANRFGVPPAFEPVSLGPEDIATRTLFHLPGSDISNTTVNKKRIDVEAGIEDNVFVPLGAGAVVEVSTSSKQTALLLLPDGASRWDLRQQRVFRDYALKHAPNWYSFVNGDLGRMVGNGDLYLVTGVTKSTTWSVAAVENHSGEGKVALRLKAGQIGSAGASRAWEWESASSSVDSGPRRNPGEELWQDNQTVFLRGFKVALRTMSLRRPKALSIVDSSWSDVSSKGRFKFFAESQPQFSRSANSLSQRRPNTGSSTTSGSTQASDDSYFSNRFHPANIVNQYLLDCVEDAAVAVTHDDEWASVLTAEDSEVPDESELIRRIEQTYGVQMLQGGVCLQTLDTSSSETPSAGLDSSLLDLSPSPFQYMQAYFDLEDSLLASTQSPPAYSPLQSSGPPSLLEEPTILMQHFAPGPDAVNAQNKNCTRTHSPPTNPPALTGCKGKELKSSTTRLKLARRSILVLPEMDVERLVFPLRNNHSVHSLDLAVRKPKEKKNEKRDSERKFSRVFSRLVSQVVSTVARD